MGSRPSHPSIPQPHHKPPEGRVRGIGGKAFSVSPRNRPGRPTDGGQRFSLRHPSVSGGFQLHAGQHTLARGLPFETLLYRQHPEGNPVLRAGIGKTGRGLPTHFKRLWVHQSHREPRRLAGRRIPPLRQRRLPTQKHDRSDIDGRHLRLGLHGPAPPRHSRPSPPLPSGDRRAPQPV